MKFQIKTNLNSLKSENYFFTQIFFKKNNFIYFSNLKLKKEFTTLNITKAEDENAKKSGC